MPRTRVCQTGWGTFRLTHQGVGHTTCLDAHVTAGTSASFREGFPIVTFARRAVWLLVFCGVALTVLAVLPVDAQTAQNAAKEPAYRAFPVFGSRLAVCAVAQLHLNFAASIVGVPLFAVIIEAIGWRTGKARYDWLSHELVKLTFAAFSTTALLGAFLLFLFVGYYPKFWTYMTSIFFPTYWVYALLFFAETFTVYLWYYGWNWLSGSRKWIHVGLGVLSNLFGTAILLVANSWVTFMMSPAGIDESGALKGSVWAAINNYTWMPINIHRLIANIVFGGTIAAAYAAFRFLGATPRTLVVTRDEVRAMGGTHHPVIGVFGVMSAKNTVVNLMILTTFLSYVLYRRANRVSTRSWAGPVMAVQWAAMGIAAAIVTYYGVKGYFVESIVRIGYSVYQVEAVLGAIGVVMAIDIP